MAKNFVPRPTTVLVALEQRSGRVITIHPVVDMNLQHDTELGMQAYFPYLFIFCFYANDRPKAFQIGLFLLWKQIIT